MNTNVADAEQTEENAPSSLLIALVIVVIFLHVLLFAYKNLLDPPFESESLSLLLLLLLLSFADNLISKRSDLSISVTTKRPASQVRTSSKEGGRENQEARKDSTSTLRSPSSSVHPNEIEHFSKLSSEWWDEHGEFGLLHSMNKVRIQFIREKLEEVKGYESAFREVHGRSLDPHLNGGEKEGQEEKKTRFLEGLKVLDVGCGGGLLSESLTRLGAKTTGLDASPSNIKIASIHSSKDPELAGGLEYIHSTAEELVRLSDSKGSYDLVLAMEVIEHVKGPGEFLTTLDSLLKPGGHLFLSTISRTNLSWFLTILMAERLLRFVTPGTHTHEQYINPEELVEFVNVQLGWKAGWSTFESREAISLPERIKIETRGTAYLPWKSSWELLGKDSFYPDTKACNYFFWARKPF
ncbi:ubiquinone biosynthesis O-methyltransferase [Violaceomyces palustris]|uniref:Ubiquinone biosynthesis O-methyltransferase n=1 Tax=Violaceomyces palustris TaxID=1673888 RepID=A0ACD0NUB8_9BASI|nr:ubiquinone biosynthesis O-methyltransferase [Violaceomyces palustris]